MEIILLVHDFTTIVYRYLKKCLEKGIHVKNQKSVFRNTHTHIAAKVEVGVAIFQKMRINCHC